MSRYTVNEIFYSVQGEGMRAGTANIFIRFTGCNMRCDLAPGPRSPGGFACDTEFESGRKMSAADVLEFCQKIAPQANAVVLTGGEPALQVDEELIAALKAHGYYLAIETNGSVQVPVLDWITVSPKVAEHAIKQLKADEVKYVRGAGQALPKTRVDAKYKLISPAFDGTNLDQETLRWCLELVKENPEWQMSMQMHKFWNVR